MLGQVKGNNCKVQLQLVVAGPVLLPTPGQGETRDEEFWGNLGGISAGMGGEAFFRGRGRGLNLLGGTGNPPLPRWRGRAGQRQGGEMNILRIRIYISAD